MNRVIIKEPGKPETIIEDFVIKLENFQSLVQGYVEELFFNWENENIVVLCNEDGKLLKLPINALGLRGNLIFCRAEKDEYKGLTDEEIQEIQLVLKQN